MEEQSNQIQIADEKKFDTIATVIKEAVEATHNYWRVEEKIRKLEEKIFSNDKIVLWNALQSYIHQYGSFIKSTSVLTGITIIYVDHAYYETLTVNDIKQQLVRMKSFMMVSEIMKTAANQGFKEYLKSYLQRLGILTKTELDFLL